MSGLLFDLRLKRIGFVGEVAYVYWLYNSDDVLLYVGSTTSLRTRLRHHYRNQVWFRWVTRLDTKLYETRAEAYEIEKEAIRRDAPRFNIQGQPRCKAHRFDSLRRRKDRGQSRLW
jgi:excinuclease UvrABC nuclease subunit